MKISKPWMVTMLVLIALTQIGCSGSNKFYNESGANSANADKIEGQLSCVSFTDTDTDLSAGVSATYDYSRVNGSMVFVPDEIRVQFKTLPQEFLEGKQKIQIYGFRYNSQGERLVTDEPYGILLETVRSNSLQVLNRNKPADEISHEFLTKISSDFKLGKSPKTLAKYSTFVIPSVDENAQGLIFVIRDLDDELIASVEALKPRFVADIASFKSLSSKRLLGLHPGVKELNNSSYLIDDYSAEACSAF